LQIPRPEIDGDYKEEREILSAGGEPKGDLKKEDLIFPRKRPQRKIIASEEGLPSQGKETTPGLEESKN